jgi:hypothetical protein
MSISYFLSLGILIFLLGAQLRLRPLLERKMSYFFWFSVIAILTTLFYYTNQHYSALLHSEPPARYLLPPYAPLSYFIHYVWSWLWSQYLLALGGSLLLLGAIKLSSKSWQAARFESEEPYLIATSLFLVGHPYWLFYFAAIILSYALYTALRAWRKPNSQRVSFYYFWIPIAIVTVAVTPLLKQLSLVHMLSITIL